MKYNFPNSAIFSKRTLLSSFSITSSDFTSVCFSCGTSVSLSPNFSINEKSSSLAIYLAHSAGFSILTTYFCTSVSIGAVRQISPSIRLKIAFSFEFFSLLRTPSLMSSSSIWSYIYSTVWYFLIRSPAPFGPIPATPGMLSEESP